MKNSYKLYFNNANRGASEKRTPYDYNSDMS